MLKKILFGASVLMIIAGVSVLAGMKVAKADNVSDAQAPETMDVQTRQDSSQNPPLGDCVKHYRCQKYYTEPVMLVCESPTETCVIYPETGQMHCTQK